jgi:hypothetical protein
VTTYAAVSRRADPRDSSRASAFWVLVILSASFVTPHDSIVSLMVVLAALSAPSWWPFSEANRRYRTLTLWGSVWFIAQFISDLWHGNDMQGAVIGAWQPVVAVVTIGFMLWSFHKARSILSVVFLAMVTQPVFFHFAAFEGTSENPWKYIYGVPVCLVGAAALDRFLPGRRLVIATIFLLAAVANFVVDYRSLAGELFVAAVIMATRGASSKARARALVGGLVAATLAVPILLFAINHGYASQDYRREHPTLAAPTNPKTYVMQGRPEFLVSTSMIEAHPWTGLGSHRALSSTDIQRILTRASNENIGLSASEQFRLFGQGANTHSLLPNAWVSAGIFAVPFWLYVLYLMGGSLSVGRRPNAVLTLGAPMLLWDAFFSPWSGHYDMVLGVLVGLALYVHGQGHEEASDVAAI